MVMMAAKVFVDTNVLLRSQWSELDRHTECAAMIIAYEEQGVELWISRQIVREYLVQITRPGHLKVPLVGQDLYNHIQTIYSLFHVADETQAVTDRLLQLVKDVPTGGKQIHDANIVATMLVNGISISHSEWRGYAAL